MHIDPVATVKRKSTIKKIINIDYSYSYVYGYTYIMHIIITSVFTYIDIMIASYSMPIISYVYT